MNNTNNNQNKLFKFNKPTKQPVKTYLIII